MSEEFKKELEELINKHNIEATCDTPDYQLADYLINCLNNYSLIARERDRYYDFNPSKRIELGIYDE